uniref:Secreted protein n=1 Tax=Cucumis sativus TaxID=3659 RepID=A0A0A0L726_CUCSA
MSFSCWTPVFVSIFLVTSPPEILSENWLIFITAPMLSPVRFIAFACRLGGGLADTLSTCRSDFLNESVFCSTSGLIADGTVVTSADLGRARVESDGLVGLRGS